MAYTKTYLMIMVLLTALQTKAQERYAISGDFRNMSFSEFVSKAESLLPVKFFYKEDWVKDIKVKDVADCSELQCMLDRIFSGTTLYYLIEESGNIIITKDYAIKVYEAPKINDGNYIQPGKDQTNEQVQQSEFEVVEFGNPSQRYKSGLVTLSGYITDEETNSPVAGVTVFCKKLSTGTISNEHGFYVLNLRRGNHLIQFTSIGMKERAFQVILNDDGELNIEMKDEIVPLKAVVITSEKSITLQRFEVGFEKININTLRLLPTTMGDPDIMKSILLIPGVKSVGEGSSGFNVRGGTADQNLILLYGAPVYYSSHFFGFFSAVNSDIIREVTLYKGGIPARYGGRISSVLDIAAKEGNRKEFSGKAGISPVTAHLLLEGPVIKDTLTYIFAARTTYSNWILDLVSDPAIRNSKASFYDLNGKITYDFNKNNRIELSGYLSNDNFRFNYDTVYRYKNHIVALKWRHFYNPRLFSSISVNSSAYKYKITSREDPYEAFSLSHRLISNNLKADFNRFEGSHEINFGVDLTNYDLRPGDLVPESDSSLIIQRSVDKENAWEGALYVDDKITLSEFLAVEGGLRLSGFSASGNLKKFYFGPEFRLAMNFRLTEKTSFKINYNRTRQHLHLLSNSVAISPTDIWKLSDYNLLPQIGDQIAVGYYKSMQKSHFEFSAEVYYKKLRNLIEFRGGANIVMNEDIRKDIVPVYGKAFGLELTLKKMEGKLRYTVGYTYSRILQRTYSSYYRDQINKGDWFPANFDKPHDLSVTCNYIISRRVSFSGNYTWSSGRPITFPVASYIIYDNKMVHYSDRNGYRIPDYARLDLSFTLNGNLKSNKLANPRWTVSVYNVLARKNVYSIFFKRENDIIRGYKLSVFGRAIPSITYSFDF